jgi:nucleoside-diphosphate-sugar epimerase
MSVVAVTGIAGYLGQRLLGLLDADGSVDRVVGVDVAEPVVVSPKLEFHQMDVRDARLGKVLAGVDVLVHLAFLVDPIHDEERMRSINVDGTGNALEAAAASGLRKVVYPSSATVYGAHPDNDFPLTEQSPLRANPDFSYAAHKLETERVLGDFKSAHPDVVVTVLRPAIVFGAHVENFISRMMEAPRILAVKGYEPPLQFVHEDDVASALEVAVRSDLEGAYNVAADGWVTAREVLELSRKRRVEVPEAVAFTVTERLWRGRLTFAPPGMLHYTMHPWVVDNAKLKGHGWKPARSNREALVETLEAHRAWVTIGRARVRKEALVRTAAALGAAGTLTLLRRMRRREEG